MLSITFGGWTITLISFIVSDLSEVLEEEGVEEPEGRRQGR